MTNDWLSFLKILVICLSAVTVVILIYILLRGNYNRERVEHAKDSIDNSRRGVADLREGNRKLEDKAVDISDGISEAVGNAENAEQSVGNARESVKRSLDIIAEIEKRKRP